MLQDAAAKVKLVTSLQEIWNLPFDIPIIIDVDTGIDDAIALLLADHWLGERLRGITTTGGNVSVEQVTRNTLGIVSRFSRTVPVYAGAGTALDQTPFTYAPEFHGDNGLAGIILPTDNQAETPTAGTALAEFLKTTRPKVVICLGPATNLASVLVQQPALGTDLFVIMMGGALAAPGNQTDKAEFNFYQDPTAVQIVWRTARSVAVVSLDVTRDCRLSESACATLPDTPAGQLTAQLIRNWYGIFGRTRGREFELYDPLTVSALTLPWLEFTPRQLTISTNDPELGAITDDYTGKRIWWANQVDANGFVSALTEAFGPDSDY